LEHELDAEFYEGFYKDFLFIMDSIRPELTASEFQIYLTLIRKSWTRNLDFLQVSISELAVETGLAIMTVKTAIRSLANKKLLKVTSKATNKTSKAYKIFRPQELQYYNEAFQNAGIKIPTTLPHSPPRPQIQANTSHLPFISLDDQDRADLMAIVGSIKPEMLSYYRSKAEEELKDILAELSEENIVGKRNEIIFFANFGPMRTGKYNLTDRMYH
jgi:DNA-binding MarR family transcriptional regulator